MYLIYEFDFGTQMFIRACAETFERAEIIRSAFGECCEIMELDAHEFDWVEAGMKTYTFIFDGKTGELSWYEPYGVLSKDGIRENLGFGGVVRQFTITARSYEEAEAKALAAFSESGEMWESLKVE